MQRSIRVTWTGAFLSFSAAVRPPKPPPRMTTLCVSMRWKILENRLACYFLHKLDETTSPNDCDKSAVDHWRKFCNSGGFCDQPGAAHADEPGGTGALPK